MLQGRIYQTESEGHAPETETAELQLAESAAEKERKNYGK